MICIIEFQLFSFPSQRNHFLHLQITGVVAVVGAVAAGSRCRISRLLDSVSLYSSYRRRLNILSSGQWVLQPLNDYLTLHNLICFTCNLECSSLKIFQISSSLSPSNAATQPVSGSGAIGRHIKDISKNLVFVPIHLMDLVQFQRAAHGPTCLFHLTVLPIYSGTPSLYWWVPVWKSFALSFISRSGLKMYLHYLYITLFV